MAGAVPLHGPPSAEERRETERQRQQEERNRIDEAFRDRQIGIAEGQLVTNQRLAVYTLLLVVLGLIGNAIAFLAANAARRSAEAALKATQVAEQAREDNTISQSNTL